MTDDPTTAAIDGSTADADTTTTAPSGGYEEALQRGYWGSVPPETPATQPTTATGEPAVVEGQPATVDVPVDAQHPTTPHPETVAAYGGGTQGGTQYAQGSPAATEPSAPPSGGSTDTTTANPDLA